MKHFNNKNELFDETCKTKLALLNTSRDATFKKNIHFQSIYNFYLGLNELDIQIERCAEYRKHLMEYIDLISLESEEVLENKSRENYNKYVEPIGLYLAEKEYYAFYTYLIYFFIGITIGLILTVFFESYIWVAIGTIMTLWARFIYIARKRRQNKLYGFQF